MAKAPQPLAVDLDGTLLQSDLLHELCVRLVATKPYLIWRIALYLAKGKAHLKEWLARTVELDVRSLPYNQEFLHWLRGQNRMGRRLILCTASDQLIAEKIAKHLAIFDEVIGSSGGKNNAGRNKALALCNQYGEGNFTYAGNSNADRLVWAKAGSVVLVNYTEKKFSKYCPGLTIEETFHKAPTGFIAWCKLLRIHQWVKNLLIFVPLLAAHQDAGPDVWLKLLEAFVAFGFCASSVYITNDMIDLESDRLHSTKKLRPFASGQISLMAGVLLGPLLLLSAFILAMHVNANFISCLLAYYLLTCFYSFGLKRLVLVDCIVLAILYSLRLIAGGLATDVPLSFWLLAFSIFIFLSLAFLKRYTELLEKQTNGLQKINGRSYFTSDLEAIQQFGVSSGYCASLVLAFYLNSEMVVNLYQTPQLIWLAVPLLLYWISRLWMLAHRGLMHEDPVLFAIKDRVSLFIGLLLLAIFALARTHHF